MRARADLRPRSRRRRATPLSDRARRGADHDGLFGPETLTWRINSEPLLIAGGGRALLLQVAHPLVAAGVAQHSDFEREPLNRLFRTLDTTYKIVFGDATVSACAARHLQARHLPVRGVSREGVAYDARDPVLLVWVWATLVETTLLVHERLIKPRSADEIERWYHEQTRFAVACGVPEGAWPPDYAAFREYFDAAVEGLRPSADSRAIVASVFHPDVPLLLRPLLPPFRIVTLGLLPPSLRERLGFSWGPAREALTRSFALAARFAMALTPGPLRQAATRWLVRHGALEVFGRAARVPLPAAPRPRPGAH
jgi:uncharacterized protein (DUF2236 family)